MKVRSAEHRCIPCGKGIWVELPDTVTYVLPLCCGKKTVPTGRIVEDGIMDKVSDEALAEYMRGFATARERSMARELLELRELCRSDTVAFGVVMRDCLNLISAHTTEQDAINARHSMDYDIIPLSRSPRRQK